MEDLNEQLEIKKCPDFYKEQIKDPKKYSPLQKMTKLILNILKSK